MALLGSAALGIAADTGTGRHNRPAPGPATTGQASPSETQERNPDLLIKGQLKLTPEERRRIRQSIENANAEEQPIPRAFAPAAGMTAPPELTLTPLPQDLQRVSGIGAQHRFARLKGGTILIIGEEGLVAAMIGPGERQKRTSDKTTVGPQERHMGRADAYHHPMCSPAARSKSIATIKAPTRKNFCSGRTAGTLNRPEHDRQ